MATKAQNIESIKSALLTLNRVLDDQSTPKTVKKAVTVLISDIKDSDASLAIVAANAISALDDITQDPNMPSYIRTSLWQAVSVLEGIRER